jgi:acyl-CoA synthetase (AMP-forming)/AMP-acid ligase II
MIFTINQLINHQADLNPEAVAIQAPNRNDLTYRQLDTQVSTSLGALRSLGIARNDPIAVVLPNGPEMATAFLSISSAATCAPLNPAYRQAEFEFYLSDLSAKAIVIDTNIDSPVRDIASSMSIPIIELEPLHEFPAGSFKLHGKSSSNKIEEGAAAPEDVALVLHTSGTTSKPKIVPLTHHNLCYSANNIRESLNLVQVDRCLNIMPLFHIHGLMAAILATITSGASVICTPGFYAPSFFRWVQEFNPTWYTAVPTMHQAILSRSNENRGIIEDAQLRFIRSCSASLPPKVMAELEGTFQAPVIEAYGMTEASHQMTSNPLPPGAQKPGSVGIPTGVEVAIMAEEHDRLVEEGLVGEIVIRGNNVTAGYANNPEANDVAFTGEWFRTGDQGQIDSDGYLFLTGRIKEIINRGGEKISPREIDEVLMDHPLVSQAVTFAIPDHLLGEDVAAVVSINDKNISERDLRQFANTRLSYFKVPRRIVIVDEIPLGPTGKLQRIGLAEKLGLDDEGQKTVVEQTEFVPPRNPVEEAITTIWIEVLIS